MTSLGKADTVVRAASGISYPWALNPIKAKLAHDQVVAASKIDPSVKADEATIKERYLELKGVLKGSGEAEKAAEDRPSVTAKGASVTTKKQRASA